MSLVDPRGIERQRRREQKSQNEKEKREKVLETGSRTGRAPRTYTGLNPVSPRILHDPTNAEA